MPPPSHPLFKGNDPLAGPTEDFLRRRVKAELRKRMRALRSALPIAACNERSGRIVERLLSLEALSCAKGVALFWPIERYHEVDLRPLGERLRDRGVRVAYPNVDVQTQAMTFRFVADPDTMQERSAQLVGLREPSAAQPEAIPGELEVIVVPALAIDPTGHRIGYGTGYYDRTLPRFVPPATSVAVAFDFQLIAEVPRTQGDVAASYVVTDSRTLQIASDS
jgi:5-formyltetrahydrofolate cyclo-ligase